MVGSLNMDLVVRAPRIPQPGETILGGAFRTFPGGKGANQAVAAARMGAQTAMVGCVGNDEHGRRLRETLTTEGIDLSGLRSRPDAPTGVGLITVAESGENAIVVSSGANATLTVPEVQAGASLIASADVLLLQLEVPMPAVIAAARIARESGKCVILNAAPACELPKELLALADVLIVNQTEAVRVLGIEGRTDPGRLVVRLPELGVQTAILTLGAGGAIVAHKGRPRRAPAAAVKTIDSVGAGDAFCGALAASWREVFSAGKKRDPSEHDLVERAVALAAAAGALATTRHGAIPAMPHRAEVEDLARSLRTSPA